ncbi:MAG: metallophosphoesterase [Lachnospiraceae bacterium]|nr:metallophosphoesterase [Lachnospiraceae bacterium]
MKKKLLALAMTFVFLLTFVTPIQAAGQPLHARDDGSFRVLIVADTQDTDKPRKVMLDLLDAELDAADADLVVLLGDNIYGPHIGDDENRVRTAIDAVMDPIVERNLPFVVTFGNHDDEDCLSKEEQLEIYKNYPGCLNDNPDISGVGNTCLPLCEANEDEAKALLWFVDSGTYAQEAVGGYDYVKEDQLNWFREGVADYSTSAMPVSYVFQHIPVPQVFELLSPAKPFEKGAISGIYNPFSDWYKQHDDEISAGSFGETPCPPKIDGGEFSAWKECGVKAAFFGHDHTNDYVGTVEGIDFIATSGIGFYAYGNGDEHGARILVLHTDRPEEYETKMVYYKDLFDEPLSPFTLSKLGIETFRLIAGGIAAIIVFLAILVLIIRKIIISIKNRKNRDH